MDEKVPDAESSKKVNGSDVEGLWTVVHKTRKPRRQGGNTKPTMKIW